MLPAIEPSNPLSQFALAAIFPCVEEVDTRTPSGTGSAGEAWESEGGYESESELVRRAQRGDLSAFEELLATHSSRLRAFVAMKLPVPHLIDEIAHEAFIFAHRHLSDFQSGTDFGKWLRAIAYNLVRKETLKHQRSTKNKERFLEHCLVQTGMETEPTPESAAVVHLEECLAKLPAQQRELLEHKYTLQESSREIAAAFQQSEAWVRTTLCRIRTALRKCIEAKAAECA
jgi:RNA polymerase sigma-70 factor (ECF subfamily)